MRFLKLLSVNHLVVSRWLKVATQILLMLVFATKSWAGAITYPNFESAELGRSYAYNLYTPDGYENSGLRYPVMYLPPGVAPQLQHSLH